jgi:Uma2 family endonuclease
LTTAELGYVEFPDLDLPYENGEPLESDRHVVQMHLCINLLKYTWRDRSDFFVGGNMLIYYSLDQAEQVVAELEGAAPKRVAYRGPDFFVVLDVERYRERKSWVVWQEGGRYPNVIVELLSPSTAETDLTVKKELYGRVFRTPEYFVWDPFDPGAFTGWRNPNGGYRLIEPDERSWLWSEQLKLWLGPWTGELHGEHAVWLRYYDAEGNLLPTGEEDAGAERAARLTERQARLAAERRAADAEQRAQALEAELARLRGKHRRSS